MPNPWPGGKSGRSVKQLGTNIKDALDLLKVSSSLNPAPQAPHSLTCPQPWPWRWLWPQPVFTFASGSF